MMPEEQKTCRPEFEFPQRIFNRPGLSRIDYNIGSYADLHEAILRRVNQDPLLAGWTHRAPDDPAVALHEGAALIGHVLTFYQEQYANELFLRTARWRESIADLVRLIGYRLAPGVGGRATFAFTFRGTAPVTIPAGFPVKMQLTGLDGTVDFETSAEVTAHPALGEFALYPPVINPPLGASASVFSVQTDLLTAAGVTIQPKDRLMLLDDGLGETETPQVVVVKKVTPRLDCTEITIEGSYRHGAGLQTVTALKLGRTFRHFGHNAPAQVTKISGTTVSQVNISYSRFVHKTTSTTSTTTISPSLEALEYPLDKEVHDLVIGSRIILQQLNRDGLTAVRTITNARPASFTWGALTGSGTLVTLDEEPTDPFIHVETVKKGGGGGFGSGGFFGGGKAVFASTNIRNLVIHETVGAPFTLNTPRQADPAANGSELRFYGDDAAYQLLKDRRVIFLKPDGKQIERTLSIVSPRRRGIFALLASRGVRLRRVILSAPLDEGFSMADFPLDNPPVKVYGNLADATQGKTGRRAVLGNGDNRQKFQTFALPKAPLTYLTDPAASPPQTPELQIYVQDRLWQAVPSLFGHGPDEEIYIVREDAQGKSYVQFGDGQTGKRLPSGVGNVAAVMRSGNAAYGLLKPNTTVQAAGKLSGLDKVYLPGLATGGAPAESMDNARRAAPGKVQSLDRLVSLDDFAGEALTIPGVDRAAAAWELVDNVPGVALTVLMQTGRAAEIAAVKATMQTYSRCRGPQRYPVHVFQGQRAYVRILLSVSFDPSYRRELVEAALRAALGEESGTESGDGLFSFLQRSFGQPEYAVRISGAAQNVPGVLWNQVTGLHLLGASDDPAAELIDRPSGLNLTTLPCDRLHLLSLYSGSLQITAVSAPEEVC